MRYRLLGRSGLRVSELAFGTMNFGTEGWGTPDSDACRTLYTMYRDAGGNFFDTANEIYSGGRSEEFLGSFMSGHRHEVVIGTKYGFHVPGPRNANIAGNQRKSMLRSVEASLARLGTDYVDVLWVHGWDGLTPVDEVMRGLDDLVRQGKILHAGISNTPAWIVARANTLAELRGWSAFVGLQIEYNLLERHAETELLKMAETLGLCPLAYSPLASGILSGKYNLALEVGHRRLDLTKGRKKMDERASTIVEAVMVVAEETGGTISQVALNWLHSARKTIPIIGARTEAQLRDNLQCLDFTLSPAQIAGLENAGMPDLAYPQSFLQWARPISGAGFADLIDP